MSQDGNGNSTEPPGGGTAMERGLPALVYQGEVIHERHEMLSLTDIWRAAGSDAARQPAEWLRSADAVRFVEFLRDALNVGNSQDEIVRSVRGGRRPGTWGHWQIALAYAKYLSPEFHMWCNTVVRQRMEGHRASGIPPELAELIERTNGICRMTIGKVTEIERSLPEIAQKIAMDMLPAFVRDAVATRRHAVVDGVCAGQVLDMAGVDKRKGLRGLAVWVTHRLRHFHATKGVAVQLANLGSRSAYVYDPLICREWLAAGGKAEIEKKVAERRGQGSLRLV